MPYILRIVNNREGEISGFWTHETVPLLDSTSVAVPRSEWFTYQLNKTTGLYDGHFELDGQRVYEYGVDIQPNATHNSSLIGRGTNRFGTFVIEALGPNEWRKIYVVVVTSAASDQMNKTKSLTFLREQYKLARTVRFLFKDREHVLENLILTCKRSKPDVDSFIATTQPKEIQTQYKTRVLNWQVQRRERSRRAGYNGMLGHLVRRFHQLENELKEQYVRLGVLTFNVPEKTKLAMRNKYTASQVATARENHPLPIPGVYLDPHTHAIQYCDFAKFSDQFIQALGQVPKEKEEPINKDSQ